MHSRSLRYYALACLLLPLVACAAPAATPTPGTPDYYQSSAPGAGRAEATAIGQPTVQIANNSSLGQILVDAQGMTLYQFGADQPNVSNCSGACADAWPPITVSGAPTAGPGVTGKLGTLQRSDGASQVTYNAIPLYRFYLDATAGDTRGENVNAFGGVWHVVRPSDTAGQTPTSATPTAAP